jgi:hypothetical protein
LEVIIKTQKCLFVASMLRLKSCQKNRGVHLKSILVTRSADYNTSTMIKQCFYFLKSKSCKQSRELKEVGMDPNSSISMESSELAA